jgi:hypothetical protein
MTLVVDAGVAATARTPDHAVHDAFDIALAALRLLLSSRAADRAGHGRVTKLSA